jgi:hypothetical protein
MQGKKLTSLHSHPSISQAIIDIVCSRSVRNDRERRFKFFKDRSLAWGLIFPLVIVGLALQFVPAHGYGQQAPPRYFRLQLKHGGQFLDADHCSSPVTLNPGSTFENGACELWRLVPAGGGWSRLQLKHGGQFLDADHCTSAMALNPGSTFDGGSCQLWRFVPAEGGWSRLQLKHGGLYLDADHCTAKLGLNAGSTFDGGSCQLWKRIPEGQAID